MNNSILIDTHAHLQFEDFDSDINEVVQRAAEAGVKYIINVGTSIESSRQSVKLAERFSNIYSSVGVHPHDAEEVTSEVITELRQMLTHPKVVAVGEIGLDFYRNRSPKSSQITAFRKLIELAIDSRKPVIIHCRDAHPDMKKILADYAPLPANGVLHCFSGSPEDVRFYLDLGFYLSFASPVTYPNAHTLREAVRSAVVEKVLLETDCPFLPPQSCRGKRNEPAYLPELCSALASLYGLTFEDTARITTLNAVQLFGLTDSDAANISAPRIAYKIRNSLYLNITNQCSNHCTFCVRYFTDYVKGHNLNLAQSEPSIDDIKKAIEEYDSSSYNEVVFCGYGEPTMRLDAIKEIASWLKKTANKKIRVNTNGHGSLINGRSIIAELKGLVDNFTVSVNAEDADKYTNLCLPEFGEKAYYAVLEFIKESAGIIPEVEITAVTCPEVNIEEIEKLAKQLNVKFRKRTYNETG